MKRKKTLILTLLALLAGVFFILPAIGFSILRWGVLPPEKLTPLVTEKVNEFIEAHLDCERIELTYFETYPYLGVRLTNGHLISHQAEETGIHETELAVPSDSLISFHRAVIVFNPTDYLFKGKITIGKVIIDQPHFYGYVNKEGQANWEIYDNRPDSAANPDSEKKPLPPIDLKKVVIRDGRFIYEDKSQDLYAAVDGFFLRIDGSFANGNNQLDIETGSSSLLFRSPAYTLSNKLALKLKSRLLLEDRYRTITLRNAELLVNNLPFTADGSVAVVPDSRTMHIDMEMGLKVSDLNDLLRFIPDAYLRNRDQLLAKGSVLLEGSVKGELGDSIVPTLNLCCKIQNGSYHVRGIEQGIDTLQMDIDLHFNGPHPDSSFISLEELTVKGRNTSLNVEGKVANLFKNPGVDMQMKGKVDFTRLAKEFLNPDTLFLDGIMEADLDAAFTVDDLLNSRYDKVRATGQLQIDRFKAYSRPSEWDMYIAGARLTAGSTDKESEYLHRKGLLNATLTVDTLNLHYRDNVRTNISQLEMAANTTPLPDTSAVVPLTARLQFERLQSRLPDSAWIVAGRTVMMGGIKASATDKRIPTAGATLRIDTLKYLLVPIRTGLRLTGSVFNIEALPYREAIRQRRAKQTSDRIRRTRRSPAVTPVTPADTVSSTSRLLRQWEARGNVSFREMNLFSRFFPLPMRMEETDLQFNTNSVTLTDARLHIGKSDLTLNGNINRIRRALLRGGKLQAAFTLESDYIDCNQLMQAINRGMTYAAQSGSTTSDKNSEENELVHLDTPLLLQDTLATEATDTTEQLFVVPKFLDLTFHTRAKRIDFKDLELTDVDGQVIVRDQSINLSNLQMNSNIGSGRLTMAYTAKNPDQATTGFDLDMKKIQVEKLIGLFPSVDTLVPMLRSFEGVVDCQLTATCRLDSTMSLLFPSLHSSCFLRGKDMVLLDGETFAEISKTLMFKNKKRNVIDSISVDLAIRDNKIEVFPFLVEMDRYRVAVGGTHNLDMTFNYHLSVLKSPVPFKLGIDIKGNLDDFKFRIVKCRYKDIFKPAKQAELDSTRRNIRQTIREAVRKQIRKAAPELASHLPAAPPLAYLPAEEPEQ